MGSKLIGSCESARELAGDLPPTADDVPITRDGRRLDTPDKVIADKVIAFLREINAERTTASSAG